MNPFAASQITLAGAITAIGVSAARRASAASPSAPSLAVQVLNRTSFGIRPTELADAEANLSDYLYLQLHPEGIDDGQVEDMIADYFPAIAAPLSQLVDMSPIEAAAQVQGATLVRALYSRRQLYEVMVEFWTNHFNVNILDGPTGFLKIVDEREVIRPHALGSFRDMLHASAKSPAMLYYLDNYANTNQGGNENYARELLELHTLGVDGGYAQRDVQEIARCFTGWGIDTTRRIGAFRYFWWLHDHGPKEVLGQQIYDRWRTVREGEAVLDLLVAHPSTARLIATKLCRRFIGDDPPPDAVNAVATAFQGSGGDIRLTLQSLFEWLSDPPAPYAGPFEPLATKIKRPFELVVSTLRTLDATVNETGLLTLYYLLYAMGQLPHAWPAPDGYPDTAAHWLNANALLDRWRAALGAAASAVDGLGHNLVGEIPEDVVSAAALVDWLSDRLLHQAVAETDREILITFLVPYEYRNVELPREWIDGAAPAIVALLLSSPYFQQR